MSLNLSFRIKINPKTVKMNSKDLKSKISTFYFFFDRDNVTFDECKNVKLNANKIIELKNYTLISTNGRTYVKLSWSS